METLNPVHKGWTILFFENISSNLDLKVWPHGDEVRVECCMMQRAQRESIPDMRLTLGFRIGDDVRGIKQLLVSKTTKCALAPVCIKHTLTKCALMQSNFDGGRNVRPASEPLVFGQNARPSIRIQPTVRCVIDCNRKDERGWIIANNECGPGRKILSCYKPMEINKRQALRHCKPQRAIVDVIRIRASIAITQQVIRAKRIVIRPAGCRRNGKRSLGKNSGLEDTLWAHQWNSNSIELKPCRQEVPVQHIPVPANLLR
jgi:hypothetical protein